MSEESAFTVTLKGGKGYEAPWIVVRGETPEEVLGKLAAIGPVTEATIAAANLFHGATNAAPLLPNAPQVQQAPPQQQAQYVPQQPAQQVPFQQQPQQAAPPAWAQPPVQQGPALHPEGKQCQACGQVLQYKVVTRKSDNKTFKFWECPQRNGKDSPHTSEFVN